MTLLDLLKKASGGALDLERILTKIGEEYPDAAALVARAINELNTAVSAENIAELASALPKELLNIVQGKLDPRDHPGDSI